MILEPLRRRLGRVRRGHVVVLTAALLPVLLGMTALSIDLGVLATARGQLQTAADAAALAAARELNSEARLQGSTNLSAEITAAQGAAALYLQRNPVVGGSTLLNVTVGSARSADLIVGYLSPTDLSSGAPDPSASPTIYNSVKVLASRDAAHGNAIPCFFGRIMGVNSRDLNVTSTATIQPYTIKGVKVVNNQNVHLLPIVLQQDNYNAMMAGTTTDEYTYDPDTGRVSSGADGVKESRIYPVRTGNPGNWGTIKLGRTNNSTKDLGNQIRYGATPQQIYNVSGGETIQLDTSTNPPSLTMPGDPGISAGIKDDLAAIVGQSVMLPIYDTSKGNGNNTTFHVIAFAPVRVLASDLTGSNKYVIVQPTLMTDASAITDKVQTDWTKGGVVRLYISR